MYRSIDSSRIRNLKLLAELKVGDKLCVKNHYYSIDVGESYTIRKLLRKLSLTGEGRNETTDSITQLVESCINQHGISEEEKKRLANEFKNVYKGIENLKTTYRGDHTSTVGFKVILEMLEEYIKLYGDNDNNNNIVDGAVAHPIVDEGITHAEEELDLHEEEVEIEDD